MFKSKSQLDTFSYCSMIFKNPILLPCEDSIGRDHLSETDLVKENKINCKQCQQEFKVRENEFKSNEETTPLIESHSYLSDEELSLKHELEESIKKFFHFCDEFYQNRTQLDSDVFDHFHGDALSNR